MGNDELKIIPRNLLQPLHIFRSPVGPHVGSRAVGKPVGPQRVPVVERVLDRRVAPIDTGGIGSQEAFESMNGKGDEEGVFVDIAFPL